MSFYDFNTAESTNYNLIPRGTIAKVNMHIRPGGYNDADMGWSGGYATRNDATGAVYLNCEFTILSGDYAGRKVWSLIGLYSDKQDNLWGDMGRSFIRSILSSAKGFKDKDESKEAIAARKIENFAELESIEFVAKIDIKNDEAYGDQNVIKSAMGPEHKDYDLHIHDLSAETIPW